MGGDQLTAARGRGAKKAKVHADSPTSRLEGLIPVAEDWHTKVVLLEVGITSFVNCNMHSTTGCMFGVYYSYN